MPELRERIGALARRAERLGTAPLALRATGEGDDQHALVVLEGEPPALAGWTLAAVVDQRFLTPRCDHCGLRRTRVETFEVWHAATRRLRQLGSGCLRDFLGGHDPERLCRQAEYVLLAASRWPPPRAHGTHPRSRTTAWRSTPSPRTPRWCCEPMAGSRVSAHE